ncbi:MAG: twin-arginine translocation pathway signal protein [Nitrospira sp.]|nr:intradiol ring-cleavage dioxygenase [Nitrospira sp.]TKB73107.1 MAG: twin-arginine translocation pathway signal protein [Nitrospira sp.]
MTHDAETSDGFLSRREILQYLSATGAAWLMAGNLYPRLADAGILIPSCVVRPEQMEGPYFVDERLNRSDIRTDPTDGQVKPGTPLTLTLRVSQLSTGGCQPLPGAQVDIWHCDALGVYSDVQDPGFNTIGRKFLRGYQMTDARGEARFITLYPGWYPGRTVHIHFKIRTAPAGKRSFEFVSQLYFNDELTDRVHAAPPYAANGPRTTRNPHDWIFRQGGDRLMLAPTALAGGYEAAFPISLQLP